MGIHLLERRHLYIKTLSECLSRNSRENHVNNMAGDDLDSSIAFTSAAME